MTTAAGTIPSPPAAVPPDAPSPEAAGLDLADLRELLGAVNEASGRLETTHTALRCEVARLKTELAEANAQLRRSRALAALGEMAAGIAHEIRNPLGSIQLYAQMLAEDVADAPGPSTLCAKIDNAVRGLDAIVRDVLLFARDMRIRPVETTARELIDATLRSCEGLVAERGVAVAVDAPTDGSDVVAADVTLVVQALANVIRNAIEAMTDETVAAAAPGPRLRITAARRRVRGPEGRPAPCVVIAVEDEGPGIPPEVVDRMFNPFFTTRATGTGLGLAIVHRIVDAHGGHVGVQNRPAGGASVELRFPDRRPAAGAACAAEPAPPVIELMSPEPSPGRRERAATLPTEDGA